MNYKILPHAVDLQDYDGFLAFLKGQSQLGYEAIHIYRTFTIFRKSGAPPNRYCMRFLPEGSAQAAEASSGRIKGLNNGVSVYAQAGEPAWRRSWAKNLTEHYTEFVPYSLGGLLLRIFRFVMLPVIMLVCYGIFSQNPSQNIYAGIPKPLVFAVLLWTVIVVGTEVIEYVVDTIHLHGLKKAVSMDSIYSQKKRLRPFVLLKNVLIGLGLLPHIIVALAILVYLV